MAHEIPRAATRSGERAARPRKLRVLMVHWDGGGNIPPHRALARELKRRGHDVHVLTSDSLAEAVVADGGRFHALARAPQWDPARPHTDADEQAFIVQNVAASPAYAADFLALHDEVGPDICVIDAMLVSTLKRAIERKLPVAALDHLAWIRDGDCIGFLNAVTAALPGPAAGSTFFGLLDRVPLVLATTYRAFGTEPDLGSHIHFLGPIREPVAPAPWPRRFPDRPFVLVSLSTVFQGQSATLRNICEALSGLPVEVLVTTGRGIAPQGLPVSGAMAVRSFVPHDAVLPSVDLVVTHAGLGTLMYSAGAGKPTLCLPNGRDQDDNAARMVALGLGRTLAHDAAPAEIVSAVTDLLREPAWHSTSRAFAAGVPRFGQLSLAAELIEHGV